MLQKFSCFVTNANTSTGIRIIMYVSCKLFFNSMGDIVLRNTLYQNVKKYSRVHARQYNMVHSLCVLAN